MTVVCGDSHFDTRCLRRFGARHRHLGSQTRVGHANAAGQKARTCWSGRGTKLNPACSAKDIVLAIIGKIGTAGGTSYTIEFAGSAIRDLSMEAA